MKRTFSIPAALVFLTLAGATTASACAEATATSSGHDSMVLVMSFGCTLVSSDQVGSHNRTFVTASDGTVVAGTYGHRNEQHLKSTSGGTIVAKTEAHDTTLWAEAHTGGDVEVYQYLDGARVRAVAKGGSHVRIETRPLLR